MMADLIMIAILCGFYLAFKPGYEKIWRYPPWFIRVLALLFVGIPIFIFHYSMRILAEVPISADCNLSSDTVAMPSSGTLYALYLPPNPEVGSGLAKLGGRIGRETKVTAGQNIFAFRCDIINHGHVPMFNVAMTLHLKFMEVVDGSASESTLRFSREWPILMPEIGIGTEGKFSFYISNTSKYMVLVTLPAIVRYKGSSGDTELTQPKEFQMLFPPSL
jgi:hypothetical protein